MNRIGMLLLLAMGAFAALALAAGPNLEQVITSVEVGAAQADVLGQVAGLKKATLPVAGMEAYELPEPSGDFVSVKCIFQASKLVLFSFETRDKLFDKAKELLQAKYGPFPDETAQALMEKTEGQRSIRLIRTGETGTAAQVIINNPAAFKTGPTK